MRTMLNARRSSLEIGNPSGIDTSVSTNNNGKLSQSSIIAFKRILAGSKIRANSAEVKECVHDTDKLYNLINGITGRITPNSMPTAKTDKELADKFADIFLAKIRKIREDLANCQNYSPEPIHLIVSSPR